MRTVVLNDWLSVLCAFVQYAFKTLYTYVGSVGSAGVSRASRSQVEGCCGPQVRKQENSLVFHFLYVKMIILPRQARDKHRENSKQSGVFSQRGIHCL